MAQESWNVDTAEGSGCQQQEGLVLCINNCGFFGCAATMNLCSQCFREKKKGSPAFTGNTSEKVAAAMVASSEKSLISTALVEKSMMPPMFAPISSATGSEKSYAKSPFSLPPADDPVSLSPSVTVDTSADVVELALPSASSSSPLVRMTPGPASSTPDLAPIAALFSPESPIMPPVARRQSINKCLTCKKRMGLLGFKCRCGNIFCATHRYSDKHACPFDYKSAGREAIAKANPIVKASKVERI